MTLNLRQLLAVSCFIGAAALTGCAAADGSASGEESVAADLGTDPTGTALDEQAGATDPSFVDAPDGEPATDGERGGEAACNQCTNCVLYARCRMPSLPYGLTTYQQKVAQINRSSPRAGCVAVINTGSTYGHVAYVTGVSGSTISIAEGNWPTGRCGGRSGTQAGLRIRGYICR